jgi:RNA polymerase sigma factor (sigma-70 family)
MKLEDEVWKDAMSIANMAVRGVANRYRAFVERDDLVQHVMEWSVRRPDKVSEYLNREDTVERKQGISALSILYRRMAERYARKEKASKLGYEVSDEFFYTPELVEKILEIRDMGYEAAGQVLSLEDGSRRKSSLPNEGGNILAMVSDVEHALALIDGRLAEVLEERFGKGSTLQQIADEWGLSHQRIDQLSRDAMRKLIEQLGGEQP